MHNNLKIRVFEAGIPITKTNPIQKWIDEWSSQVFVKITSNRKSGWGETLPAVLNSTKIYSMLIKDMGNLIRENNPENIRTIWDKLSKASFSGGSGVVYGAMSGIDIALWNLKATMNGLSLTSLLGNSEGRARRYASLSRYKSVDDVLSIVENLYSKGFDLIKLHQSKDDTMLSIQKIRETIGYNVNIAVDMNCAFGFTDAKKFVEDISHYEPLWIEEPLWPHNNYKGLSKLNKIWPIAAGENAFYIEDFKEMIDLEALTYYQPDIAKIGGITPALDLIAILKSNNLNIACHNRPHNGWVSAFASASLSIGLGIDTWIETPPFNPQEKYFNICADINEKFISSKAYNLSITPKEPIPKKFGFHPLIFH